MTLPQVTTAHSQGNRLQAKGTELRATELSTHSNDTRCSKFMCYAEQPGVGSQNELLTACMSTHVGSLLAFGMALPVGRLLTRFLELRQEGFPLSAFWRGFWLRRHFRTSGLILALPGGPMPTVINRGGRIDVENCVFEPGVRLELSSNAELLIGKGVYFNRNVHFVVAESVRVGDWVKIGWDVVIMDTDLHGHSGKPLVSKPVVIGDDVWIGCRALILKGVHIGEGAVIGAGAIVTKNVPPHTVVTSPRADVLIAGSSAKH